MLKHDNGTTTTTYDGEEKKDGSVWMNTKLLRPTTTANWGSAEDILIQSLSPRAQGLSVSIFSGPDNADIIETRGPPR
jgi:hypothetical protein